MKLRSPIFRCTTNARLTETKMLRQAWISQDGIKSEFLLNPVKTLIGHP